MQRLCLLVFTAMFVVSCSMSSGSSASNGRRAHVAGGQRARAACTRYAAPWGSDGPGHGGFAHPFASLTRLDRSLSPGQTGCLRAGTYGGIHSQLRLLESGTSSARITIRSYPGEVAKVAGWIEMEGSYQTLSHLRIDGSNTFYDASRPGTNCHHPVSQGLVIAGHDDIFEHNDYFQSVASLRGNGLGVGWWGDADGTIIRYNRVHDVGQCLAFDHLIYLDSGSGVQIYNNWMWNDRHGWGVQIYPQARGARVHNNVIDHAGSGFLVAGDPNVSDNLIEHNIVIDSTGLASAGLRKGVGISDYWGSAHGIGNVFQFNDVHNNPGGIARVSAVSLRGNTAAAPLFVNAPRHYYRVLRIGRGTLKIQTPLS